MKWVLQRLVRDFKRLQKDPPQGINGSPNPDNIMQWNAVIFGPEDTPWDGGNSKKYNLATFWGLSDELDFHVIDVWHTLAFCFHDQRSCTFQERSNSSLNSLRSTQIRPLW